MQSVSALLGLVLISFLIVTPVFSAANGPTRPFSSMGPLVPGELVSIAESSDNQVVQATVANATRLIGVASEVENDLLAITSGDNTVQVATNGLAQVLVSDINGSIEPGDLLVPTNLRGIAAKATDTDAFVLGIATTSFDETDPEAQQFAIEGADQSQQQVNIGYIVAQIGVLERAVQTAEQDAFLVALGESIVGKAVSPLQVVIATIVFVLIVATVSTLLFGAIKSGFTAIGRNPLSQGSIFKNLLQVSLLSAFILGVGLVTVYLILWL